MTAKTNKNLQARRALREALRTMAAGPPRGPVRIELDSLRRRKATKGRPAH